MRLAQLLRLRGLQFREGWQFRCAVYQCSFDLSSSPLVTIVVASVAAAAAVAASVAAAAAATLGLWHLMVV